MSTALSPQYSFIQYSVTGLVCTDCELYKATCYDLGHEYCTFSNQTRCDGDPDHCCCCEDTLEKCDCELQEIACRCQVIVDLENTVNLLISATINFH